MATYTTTLTSEDRDALCMAFAGDWVAQAVTKIDDARDYRAMLARSLMRCGEFTDSIPSQREIIVVERVHNKLLRERVEEVYGNDFPRYFVSAEAA